MININTLLLALDLAGTTFVFALSGAAAGVSARLDIFGVLVLSFAAATAGGIGRDLLSHKSNGRSGSLSRSCNRLISEAATVSIHHLALYRD
jgi:uncharacterized membrane protein YeiH